jgi:hypothetical protein
LLQALFQFFQCLGLLNSPKSAHQPRRPWGIDTPPVKVNDYSRETGDLPRSLEDRVLRSPQFMVDENVETQPFDHLKVANGIMRGHVVFFSSDGCDGDYMFETATDDLPPRVRAFVSMLHEPKLLGKLTDMQAYAPSNSALIIRTVSNLDLSVNSRGDYGSFYWYDSIAVANTPAQSHIFQNCLGAKAVLLELIQSCQSSGCIPTLVNYLPYDDDTLCHFICLVRSPESGAEN